jgi:predicted membrane-bound spermidine synthase
MLVWYQVLIFVTGAATLALEVLASRIMTPYFGVSLYIWAGILSITLTFLALGYSFGGWLTRKLDRGGTEFAFLAAPPLSALSIVAACLLFPPVFPALAEFSLIVGSFAAGTLLLALPLVVLSALNPLLVALMRPSVEGGDGGAGRVFFISTVGSVAGVLVTAFLFIPTLENYRALLLIGCLLCAGSLALAFSPGELLPRHRRRIVAGSVLVAGLSLALLFGQNAYFDFLDRNADRGYDLKVKAVYKSVYGNVKVIGLRSHDPQAVPSNIYMLDGRIENQVTPDGIALTEYTYVLEKLATAYSPPRPDVLVLGLAAGVVPRAFKRDGARVAVVDINPDSLIAATEYFNFDASGIELNWEDARTFARRCRARFDTVVVDLFQGGTIPDHLLTAEFFGDLARCVRPRGLIVMNVVVDRDNDHAHRRLLATVNAAFSHVRDFLPPAREGYIVASNAPVPANPKVRMNYVPTFMIEGVARALGSGRAITPDILGGARPVTDGHNVFSILYAETRLSDWGQLLGQWSPHVLVN